MLKSTFMTLLALLPTLAFAAPLLAGGSGLVSLLVTLVVVGLICWLLYWFVGFVGLPEPFNKVALVIIALVAVIFLINTLLALTGTTLF